MNSSSKTNLLNFDRDQLAEFFHTIGEPSYRAQQLLKRIYQQGMQNFDDMTEMSKSLRRELNLTTVIDVPEIVTESVSSDGTRKWLLRLSDANCIETVYIPEENRGTLCVSSQVGCALKCSFCYTAVQGFNRNLSTAEIIAQLWVANRELRNPIDGKSPISNVVMMGMGEPLLNYDNVLRAIRLMTDDNSYSLSKRRVTVSTAGVVPMIERLIKDSDVSLAISLHASNDALRDQLVPINKKFPLQSLMATCKHYVQTSLRHRRKIVFEYTMLKGINDSIPQAYELVRLLKNIPSKVNLIPFNPFGGAQYQRSSETAIAKFQNVLWNAGIITIIRKTRGDDISAACGQLAGKVMTRLKHRNNNLQRSKGL